MKEQIIEIAKLISNKEHKYWYILKSDILNIFGTDDTEVLLTQFENNVESFEKQKKPELTLVFFIAFMILYDENDKYNKLIKRTNNKEYLKYLKAGLKKYLQGKSNSFRYVHKLNSNSFKNPYDFISMFSGWLPEYDMKFRGFLNVIDFFLQKDQETFFEILSVDSQNAMSLTAILHPTTALDWRYFNKWLIKSDDELKQNVAIYLVLSEGKYLTQRTLTTNEKILEEYLSNVSSFLYSIPSGIAPKLLLNYLFGEGKPLNIVYEYFKNMSAKDLVDIDLINRKINLNEICILILLSEYVAEKEELEKFVLEKFFDWLNFNCLESEWSQNKDNIINGFLKHIHNIELYLDYIEKSLYVHEFDKEIRFKKYLQDIVKLKIIHEIRGIN